MLKIFNDIKFSLLKKLYIENFFEECDIFFTELLNPALVEESIFLAYLFKISRSGYVALKVNSDEIYPDEILDYEIKKNIIEGAKAVINSQDEKKFTFLNIFEDWFYLQKNYFYETILLKNIFRLKEAQPVDFFDNDKFKNFVSEHKLFNYDQKQALLKFSKFNVFSIYGGPGSGKTFLASELIDYILKNEANIKIAITAPTGKAALHLKNKILSNQNSKNLQVMTLHKLLNFNEYKTAYFQDDFFDYDLILVDESSMIDLFMMAHILNKISFKTKILFIGDPHQLSPIEGGAIFSEFIRENIFESYYLKDQFRFENQKIIKLANAIIENDEIGVKNFLDNSDMYMEIKNLKEIKENIFELSKHNFNLLNKKIDINIFEKFNKFRILTALKRGMLSVDDLNNQIFKTIYNSAKFNDEILVPIIINKNSYSLELYNGMLGVLLVKKNKTSYENLKAYFLIDKEIKEFFIFELPLFEYAYAISIHKSQGSEFNEVMLIINENVENFSKELIYTGITRAKKNIKIISTKNTILKILSKKSVKISAISKRLEKDCVFLNSYNKSKKNN
ncbi:MAG: hypothetical protein A3F40_00115 [Chlamydiae bacterium RIFCSPHIGHO2_12_FULL_27_8]|nr:MAG: hypothetical protein A3F40_00115 [Chlamydiae bacterium RIFCSPHIGHO2_12_FULL_27_8]